MLPDWIRGSVWPWAAPAVAELVVERPGAQVDALVADRGGGAGDDSLDVAGGFAAERTACELATELAVRVVAGELGGDVPRGCGELLVSVGVRVEVGVGIVEGGGELVEGAVQLLPGGDGEPGGCRGAVPRVAASRG